MAVVVAAIDMGESTERVLRHAAGFARVLSATLRIVHVASDPAEARQRVTEYLEQHGPYEIDLGSVDVVVRAGRVSEMVVREAIESAANLIVIGSRNHGLARFFLGSTSDAVLRSTTVPVLLVPPISLDIVNLDDARLTTGPVVAAVDLSDPNVLQLTLASRLAAIAGQNLILMTVAQRKLTDQEASTQLRERAHGLEPVRPHALIVRRGDIPEQISQCAAAEDAGLVVMGLRSRPRSTPGVIASAVLRTNRAFVLAVPAT
jgi:nucleotide-binding universal stress UspA family protein